MKKNLAAFDRKRIEVTAYAQRSFEDFSLFDPSGTIYCCGVSAARKRREPLVVQRIRTHLVTDRRFRKFDRLIQRTPDSRVRATVSGRFFAGPGYGHMGCCSLLVIEQVLEVTPP